MRFWRSFTRVMKTRSVEEIDGELRKLRQQVLDCVRGTEKWNVTWEWIDKLLEERSELHDEEPVP